MHSSSQIETTHIASELTTENIKPDKQSLDQYWYCSDSNKCCIKFSKLKGPINIQELHKLWLTNEITNKTMIYSEYVTSQPTEINKIFQKETNTKTISLRIEQEFEIGDQVRFKSWLSSPEGYSSWIYITKRQKGIVKQFDNKSEYVTVDFEADTGYKCAKHEIENVTKIKTNIKGSAKCFYYTKRPINFISDLHSKFKNHIIGLLVKLFTESYDIITDILFTMLLYNKMETDLFIISVISICLPSILSYIVSLILLCYGSDWINDGNNTSLQMERWSNYCFGMIFCSCCFFGFIFPLLIILSTIIKLYYCVVNRSWFFTKNKKEVYGNYPLIMFQVIMTFFIRTFEDLPQIIINIVFVYDRNDGKIELINILSIIGSILVIVKTILFDWREFDTMRAYAKGVSSSDHSSSWGLAIVNGNTKINLATKRRNALGLI